MTKKQFNNVTLKWENVEIKEQKEMELKENVTHIDSWKPTLDSVRQAFARGMVKKTGTYQYDEDGQETKNIRTFDKWEKPDLTEVDDKIKKEQTKNKKKKIEAENKKLEKEFEQKRKEAEEEETEKIKKVLAETIKMSRQ